MTDEVKFTDEQWDKVAQAAETFATALDNEKVRLRSVLATNWAGACSEGEGTMENLRALLHGSQQSFEGAMESEATYLRGVASACTGAKRGLDGEDGSNAAALGR